MAVDKGKRTFKLQGKVVDIPSKNVDVFLEKYPDAKEMASYIIGKDTVDIPIENESKLLEKYPDAKPTYGVKKKGNSGQGSEEAGTPSKESGFVEDKLSEQYNPFAQTVNQEKPEQAKPQDDFQLSVQPPPLDSESTSIVPNMSMEQKVEADKVEEAKTDFYLKAIQENPEADVKDIYKDFLSNAEPQILEYNESKKAEGAWEEEDEARFHLEAYQFEREAIEKSANKIQREIDLRQGDAYMGVEGENNDDAINMLNVSLQNFNQKYNQNIQETKESIKQYPEFYGKMLYKQSQQSQKDKAYEDAGVVTKAAMTVTDKVHQSVWKFATDILTLPRTVMGDNTYGYSDRLAEIASETADDMLFASGKISPTVQKQDMFSKTNSKEAGLNPHALFANVVGMSTDMVFTFLAAGGVAKGITKIPRLGLAISQRAAGNIGMFTSVFVQTHNNAYEAALAQGASHSQASKAAGLSATGVGFVNTLNPMQKVFMPKINYTQVAKKVIGGEMTTKQILKDVFKEARKNFRFEGGEELLEVPVEKGANIISNALMGTDLETSIDPKELLANYVLGGTNGFAFSIAGSFNNPVTTGGLYESLTNKKEFDEGLQSLVGKEIILNNEKITYTQDMANEFKKDHDALSNRFNSIVEQREFSEDEKFEVMQLVTEKLSIQEKIDNGVDETVQPKYEARINEINEKLTQLQNPNEGGQDTGGGTGKPTSEAQGETKTQEAEAVETKQGTSTEEVNLQTPQDENKAPEKVETQPRVLSTPTDEKYAVVNRNDGKGEVYLTKEEYEKETGFEQAEVDQKEAGQNPTSQEKASEEEVEVLPEEEAELMGMFGEEAKPKAVEQKEEIQEDKKDESETDRTQKVKTVAVSDINQDPKRFQYKSDVNEETGVSEKLKGRKWNPNLAGVVSVWTDPKDGKTYVINGHHRLDLAKANNVENIDVREIEAENEAEAREIGAMQNIAEGQGTDLDAAKIIREGNLSGQDLEDVGLGLSEAKASNGLALAALSDSLFDAVVRGDVKTNVGIIIGNNIKNKDVQEQFYNTIKGKNLSNATIEVMAQDINAAPTTKEVVQDLFGTTEQEVADYENRAKFISSIRGLVSKAKNVLGKTAKSKQFLEEFGNKIDKAKSEGASQEAAVALAVFDQLRNTSPEIKALIDEGVKRIKNGESKSKVQSETAKAVIDRAGKILEGKDNVDVKAGGKSNQDGQGNEGKKVEKEKVKEAPKSPSPAGTKEESPKVHDEAFFDKELKILSRLPKEKKATKAKAIKEKLRKAKGDTITQEEFDKLHDAVDSKLDVILEKLDAAIEATSTKGKAYDASLGIPVAIAHESLKAVRQAYKAGKSVAEAIKAGLKWLRDNKHKVDEKAYAKFVEDQISEPRTDYTDDFLSKAEQGIKNLISKGNTPIQAIKKAGLILEKNGKIEDRAKFEEQMKDRMGIVPPVTKSSIKKEGKKFAKKEKEVEKQAEEQSEERLSGIKNELIPEEKRDSYELNKRTFQDLIDTAKALIKSKAVNPRLMLKDFIENQKTITPEETAIMVVYKTTLDNKRDALMEAIEKDSDLSNERLLLADVNEQIDMFHEMQRRTGYEQGLTLAARKMMMNSEFDLANQVRVFKAITGRSTVPPEVMQKFEQVDKEFRAAKKRIDELDAELEKAKGKIEVLSAERQKNIKERGKKAADMIRKAKFTQTMADLAKLQSDPLGLFKGAWDGVVETIATTLEVTTSIAQVVDAGLKKFKESDWYRNLSEKGKKEADRLMRKGVYEQTSSMMGVPLPEMDENGNLFIPDEFVKELIRDGFDTIEKATTEARKRIKENSLLDEDVTERQVRDAISNYGKRSQLSKDETDKKLREFKRVGKLLSALEDVKKKKRPLRSGRERDELIQEERLLRQQINELLKDVPLTSAEQESNWKSALDAYKKRLKNRKEDLEKQIKEGKRARKGKKSIALDVEAKGLKEEVEALEAILESIDSKSNLTYEQKVRIVESALVKAIEQEQKRIKNKDFAPVEQPKISTPKIEKLRAERKKLTGQRTRLWEKSEKGKQAKTDKEVAKIEKKINEIDKQIEQKIYEATKTNAKPELNQQIKAAKERLKAKRELLKETEAYKEHAEKVAQERLKKHIKKEIKRYQERIKNRDFAIRKSAEQKLDEESKKLHKTLTKVKEQYELEKEKARLANRSNFEKFSDMAVNAIGIPRAMMAALDFSAPLRQGFILSTRNPRAAAKAFKEMFKQAFSAERNENWMADLKETEAYHKMKKMGLYISDVNASLLDKEEAFTSNYAERIGTVKINGKRYGYGSLIKGSNRAYSAYLNVLRVQVYQSFAERMYDRGMTESNNPRVFKEMATFVNNATGRGSLYQLEGAEKLLNGLFFAPRYVSSRFNIVGNTLTGFAAYSAPVRAEAQKTMLAYIGTTMTILALAAAMGADVEDDPRSSDFGKIRVGNTRYDIGAGHLQVVRFMASTILYLGNRFNAWDVPEMKSSTTGGTYYLNENRPYATSIGDVWLKFGRSKAAPLTGTIMDFMATDKEDSNEGDLYRNKVYFQNIVGEEMTIGDKTLNLISPMFLQDMIEIYRQEGVGKGLGSTFPALFGVGVMNYGDKESSSSSIPKVQMVSDL